MGAYIDILPLDDMPGGDAAKRVQETALKMQIQMYASAALDECEGAEISESKEAFCYGAGGISGQYNFLQSGMNASVQSILTSYITPFPL